MFISQHESVSPLRNFANNWQKRRHNSIRYDLCRCSANEPEENKEHQQQQRRTETRAGIAEIAATAVDLHLAQGGRGRTGVDRTFGDQATTVAEIHHGFLRRTNEQ